MFNNFSDILLKGMFDIWHVMDKCTVVAKKELFYAWPFGLAAWLCGLIFIDRMNSDKARAVINKATLHIKEKKVSNLHLQYLKFYAFERFQDNILAFLFCIHYDSHNCVQLCMTI